MSRVLISFLLCVFAPFAHAGVIGNIEGAPTSGGGFQVVGWACSTGVSQSIDVHVYVGGSAGTGTGVAVGKANLASEAAVSSACQTTGVAHRFVLTMPASVRQAHANKPIYVHGISPNGGTNDLIARSGMFNVPPPITGVIGQVESATALGSGLKVSGWACSASVAQSISVHFYVGGPAGTGTGVGTGVANLASDTAVSNACQTSGVAHRFDVTLPASVRQQYANQLIYVHGISPNGGSNLLLSDSGLLSVPGPVYTARKYTYNANNELCKVVEPETGATLYGYDAAGNLVWSASGLPETTPCGSTDASVLARKATRTYDARGRLTSLSFPDGRGNVDYTYERNGATKTLAAHNDGVNNRVVTTTYTHDRRGLLEFETMQFDTTSWSVDYVYNGNAHLQSQNYHGQVIDFSPNALGQATKAGTFATGASYYPNGALKQFTYGNGIVHTLTQNVRGLPDNSRDAYGTTKFLDDSYDFDGNANVAAITDGATGTSQRGNRTMTYDGLDRLTKATSLMFGTTASSAAGYEYDALDNLTRVTVNSTPTVPGRDWNYYYDATQRLTNVQKFSDGSTVIGLDYDPQGNLTQKSVSGSDNFLFDFDYGNRLRQTSRQVSSGQQTVSQYLYDGEGRRIRDYNTGAIGAAGSKYSQYTQAGELIQTSDARNGTFSEYVYLAGSLIAIRERTGPPTAYVYTTKYQHTDALGSPVVVTDSNRVVLERNEYEPYGKVLAPLPVSDGPGFTGHVLDAATGINYMEQRYYDPGLGLFLSVDPVEPLSKPGTSFNRYWYAGANPYRFVDPDGREFDITAWLLGAQSDTLGSRRDMQEYNKAEIRAEGRAVVNQARAAVNEVMGRFSFEVKAGVAGRTYSVNLANGQSSVTYGTPIVGFTLAAEMKIAVAKGDMDPKSNGSNTTISAGHSTGEGVMAGVYAESTTTGEWSSGLSFSVGVEGEGSPVTVTEQLPDTQQKAAPQPAPATKPAAPKRERAAPIDSRIKR